MSIIGFVLTLSPHCEPNRGALSALAEDPRVDIGEIRNHRLPVVVELRDAEEERFYLDALRSTPGVIAVDVAFAALDQPQGNWLQEASS